MNRKQFFAVASSVVLSSSFLVEVYSRIGAWFIGDDDSERPTFLLSPSTANGIEHATIVFHGSGGQDSYTNALMEQLRKKNPNGYNQIVEWSRYSTNIFRASYNGERIGQLAAQELVRLLPHLKTIHIIGISVGSFAADSAAKEIKSIFCIGTSSCLDDTVPFVQLTLLDPFTQKGIFGLGYGTRMFGSSADYTQQFLNTDDPVPSTNQPLKRAVCYDITDLRPDNIFGHDWPVAYYARSDRCGQLYIQPDKQAKAGSVVQL
jgi:hypothetical protein